MESELSGGQAGGGRGSAVVYRVRDRRLNRPAALRVLREESPAEVGRFVQEARAAWASGAARVEAILDGGADLSLPAVTTGIDYRVVVPGSTEKCQLAFESNGNHIRVGLLARQG